MNQIHAIYHRRYGSHGLLCLIVVLVKVSMILEKGCLELVLAAGSAIRNKDCIAKVLQMSTLQSRKYKIAQICVASVLICGAKCYVIQLIADPDWQICYLNIKIDGLMKHAYLY